MWLLIKEGKIIKANPKSNKIESMNVVLFFKRQ